VSIEGEYLVCRNEQCPARKVGRLKRWIGELGLLDWGERTLERFHDEGLVTEPADLYKLTVEKISALEGFGEVSAKRLLDPLRERMKIPMATFIAALGIETVSRETAKLLVNAGYDTIDKLAEAKVEALSEIPGLGDIKAERIAAGVRTRLDEVKRLEAVGVAPIALKEGGPLAGLSFCFSGAHSRPRKELEALVEKHGGSVVASVTKGLKYLVLADKDSTSSKAQKAKKLGVEVIDEAAFDRIIGERLKGSQPA
jgi:DNA ligase (NAD+)